MTAPEADPTGGPTDAADPAELLALAVPVAEAVADELVVALGRARTLTSKSGPTDLVTEMDTWAEAHITAALLGARPDDGVHGEEGADRTGTSGITWCVDPIDGTVNYVHGLPGFCVSIAAQVDGRSVAGVVVSPLHRETFAATRGGGATCNGATIRCADPESVARSVVGTGYGYDPARRRRQAEVVARVIDQVADIRRFGAAALDLCFVGAGRLDGYWEVGLNAWDHAAGGLIATEAGAVVAGFDGGPASEASILAAPPHVWDELAGLLRGAGAAEV